jgi:hypothetical protein
MNIEIFPSESTLHQTAAVNERATCALRAIVPSRGLTQADWTAPKLFFRSANVRLTNEESRHAYHEASLMQQTTRYQPVGPMLNCFGNVEVAINKFGGTLVCGWQVCASTVEATGVELEAHAVWRTPSGELVEVTEADPAWLFAPSNRLFCGAKATKLSGSEQTLLGLYRLVSGTGHLVNIVNRVKSDRRRHGNGTG